MTTPSTLSHKEDPTMRRNLKGILMLTAAIVLVAGPLLALSGSDSLVFKPTNPTLRYTGNLSLTSLAGSAIAIFNQNGQTRLPKPSAATAASCTSAAGCAAATVTGSDSALLITLGSSLTANAFTITFGGTWAAAPTCVVVPASSGGAPAQSVATTTTTAIVTLASIPGNATKFSMICLGNT
jgi:hypothetical protein